MAAGGAVEALKHDINVHLGNAHWKHQPGWHLNRLSEQQSIYAFRDEDICRSHTLAYILYISSRALAVRSG
jgi:hypothetical protein